MSSQALAATFVLMALQLVVLRASQHAVPSLYFTTSSLFDRRADVAGKAVLFRLAIPFIAGTVAALLAPDDAFLVAALAGGGCWFLAIWPIVWNPRLVSHRLTLPFLCVLAAFWLAYAVLPMTGVASVELVADVISEEGGEWKSQYVWAFVTGGTLFLLARSASWLAGRSLSFVDDASRDDEPGSAEKEGGGDESSESGIGEFLLLYGAEAFGVAAIAMCATAILVLARRRP